MSRRRRMGRPTLVNPMMLNAVGRRPIVPGAYEDAGGERTSAL